MFMLKSTHKRIVKQKDATTDRAFDQIAKQQDYIEQQAVSAFGINAETHILLGLIDNLKGPVSNETKRMLRASCESILKFAHKIDSTLIY